MIFRCVLRELDLLATGLIRGSQYCQARAISQRLNNMKVRNLGFMHVERPRLKAGAVRHLPVVFVVAASLAGCAKPVPVAVLPPAPVGQPYKVFVGVPPAPPRVARHQTPAQMAAVQQAFNVVGLKSALMVAALSCNQQDKYDAFMGAFQPHVLAEQHVMDGYFRQIGGRAGQAQEDNFVTLLANNQSVTGIAQGSAFCLNNQAEFQQVMALKSDADLDNFVTDQPPSAASVRAAAGGTTGAAPAVTTRRMADDTQQ